METEKPIPYRSPRQELDRWFARFMDALAFNDITGPFVRGKDKKQARYWRFSEKLLETANSNERRQFAKNAEDVFNKKYKIPLKAANCLSVSS